MARQSESEAMKAARAELAAVLKDLRGIKARVVDIVRRLKSAARSADVVVTAANGERFSSEGWMADELREFLVAMLAEAIACVADVARADRRPQIREDVRREDEKLARQASEKAAAGAVS